MPTFPVHTIESAPDSSKILLNNTKKNFGFIPNLIGVMASSPAITEAYLAVADIFTRSSLSPTEQQVVLLTVSHFHHCTYCMAAHTAIADMQNVDPQIVQSIRDNLPLSDGKLQVLRQFTHLVLENRGWLEDADMQAFLDAGYTEGSMLDVMVGISQKVLSNFTNHIAKTPLDDAFTDVAWEPAQV